jgi:CNT family concentrative nucleoside transporter
MSALEHRDTTADRQELSSDSSHPVLQTEAHNSSPQFGVVRNNDPVLDIAREHHHAHTQHAASALKGRDNEMDYSAGTTDEPQTIPHQDAMDNALHRRHIGGGEKSDVGIHDMEKGGLSPVHSEVDPKSHRMGKYRPKIRVVVHLAFFLLFTGSVSIPLTELISGAAPKNSDGHFL